MEHCHFALICKLNILLLMLALILLHSALPINFQEVNCEMLKVVKPTEHYTGSETEKLVD